MTKYVDLLFLEFKHSFKWYVTHCLSFKWRHKLLDPDCREEPGALDLQPVVYSTDWQPWHGDQDPWHVLQLQHQEGGVGVRKEWLGKSWIQVTSIFEFKILLCDHSISLKDY